MEVQELETPEKQQEKKSPDQRASRRSLAGAAIVVVIGAVLLAIAIITGLNSRAKASTALHKETDKLAIATVAAVHPALSNDGDDLGLPGNMQAFTDTPIYARSSGYLRHWYVDIGARVKAGQLLADIEAPEVDRQLQQARADQATAQANFDLSQSTAKRYKDLLATDSVSRQEADDRNGDLAARLATLNAQTAAVKRLQEVQGFQRIYAPFDGVITARNTDLGALIDSGANSPGRELFHLAAIHKLRVYVSVPQIFYRSARPGVMADVELAEYPGRIFRGKLVRTSDAIDASSRTLLVEVDVDNPTGELLPGAYVSVHLKFPAKTAAVVVPVNTLIFRAQGLQVARVAHGKTQLVSVTMGRDFGDTVEIVRGLSLQDLIIINPSDSISSGEQVNIESNAKENGHES